MMKQNQAFIDPPPPPLQASGIYIIRTWFGMEQMIGVCTFRYIEEMTIFQRKTNIGHFKRR